MCAYGSCDVGWLASFLQDASPWLELLGAGGTGDCWRPGGACSPEEKPKSAPAKTARTIAIDIDGDFNFMRSCSGWSREGASCCGATPQLAAEAYEIPPSSRISHPKCQARERACGANDDSICKLITVSNRAGHTPCDTGSSSVMQVLSLGRSDDTGRSPPDRNLAPRGSAGLQRLGAVWRREDCGVSASRCAPDAHTNRVETRVSQ